MTTKYLASLLLGLAAMPCLADQSAEAAGAVEQTYSYATNGMRDNIQRAAGSKWKLLLDESNVGGNELEAAELLLPAGPA